MTTQPPKPETIDKLTWAAYPAFAMLAGMQLDVFTPLSDGPKTIEEVAEGLRVQPLKLKPLLYALVSVDLLEVEDERFSNTIEADYYLSSRGPGYRAPRLVRRWESILKTAETIRTGVPQAKLDFAGESPAVLERFYRGGHAETLAASQDLLSRYDFSNHRHLVDIAGGSGGLAISVVTACPSLRATVIDLPSVTPITQQIVDETEVAGRIEVASGDVVEGPLTGTYDVAVMRSFIQVLSQEQARHAINNVGQVIEPGGMVYIMGTILDNSYITPPEAAIINLNYLNTYDHGQAYTQREHENWLSEAGFGDCNRVVLSDGVSIMTARKFG